MLSKSLCYEGKWRPKEAGHNLKRGVAKVLLLGDQENYVVCKAGLWNSVWAEEKFGACRKLETRKKNWLRWVLC